MSAPSEEVVAEDELLTSYLDQELSVQDRAALELRLVHDEPLRNRLAELRRAWELLDELPETPFTPNFTQTTLEMVAIDLEKERDRALPIFGLPVPGWFPQLSYKVRMGLLCLSLILVGATVGLILRSRARTIEARNIAIAARYPSLKDFGNLEDLRPLLDLPHWKSLFESDAIRNRVLIKMPENSSRDAIDQFLISLDGHQKELLWNQLQTFERLPPQERAEIERRFDASLTSDAEPDLHLLAAALNGLMQNMSSNRRSHLANLPPTERISELSHFAAREIASIQTTRFTVEERRKINEWRLRTFLPWIRSMLGPRDTDVDDIRSFSYWTFSNNGNFWGREGIVDSFCEYLNEDKAKLLRSVLPAEQSSVITEWVLEDRSRSRNLSNDEMFELYDKLDPDRKSEIELRQPEDARRDLQRSSWSSKSKRGPRPGGIGPPGAGGGPGGFGPQGPGGAGLLPPNGPLIDRGGKGGAIERLENRPPFIPPGPPPIRNQAPAAESK